MEQSNSQDEPLEESLNQRISETQSIFSLFSNTLTAVTWISLNIVALYIFFIDYFPLMHGKAGYIIAFGLTIISAGSCFAVIGLVFYTIIPMLYNAIKDIGYDEKSQPHVILILPMSFVILIGFLIFILTSQALISLGIISTYH